METKVIEEQLKLSKKQDNKTRYEYMCKESNAINYAIKLEKYTIKLLKENKKIKKENEALRKIKQNYINSLQQEFEMKKLKC